MSDQHAPILPSKLPGCGDNGGPVTVARKAADSLVASARAQLGSALGAGRDGLATLRESSIDGAKAANRMLQLHPFGLVGGAFCVGGLLGFLFVSRK